MSFVYPRSYIGVIGGGQDNWQLIQAAHRLGFLVNLLVENAHDLAAKEADQVIVGAENDVEKLRQLAAGSQVVIFHSEKVSINALNEAQIGDKLPQGTELLALTQDRYLEKTFLEDHKINIVPYAMVVTLDDIREAVESIGYPCVLKPIQKGLHQRGYKFLRNDADVEHLAGQLHEGSYVLESWIPDVKEYAIMVSKDQQGHIQTLPILQTNARQGQMISVFAHQHNPQQLADEIKRVARKIADQVEFQGLLAVTFFATKAGILFANRLYPGLYEAADLYGSVANYSQYELQLRNLCAWSVPNSYLRQEGVLLTLPATKEPEIFGQIQKRTNWKFLFWPVIANQSATDQTIGEATVVANDYASLMELVENVDLWA